MSCDNCGNNLFCGKDDDYEMLCYVTIYNHLPQLDTQTTMWLTNGRLEGINKDGVGNEYGGDNDGEGGIGKESDFEKNTFLIFSSEIFSSDIFIENLSQF